MKHRRRVEITIHRRNVAALPVPEASLRDFCPKCRREVNMLNFPLAAQTAGVSTRTLHRWIGEDRIHYIEDDQGNVRICEHSLPGLLPRSS